MGHVRMENHMEKNMGNAMGTTVLFGFEGSLDFRGFSKKDIAESKG